MLISSGAFRLVLLTISVALVLLAPCHAAAPLTASAAHAPLRQDATIGPYDDWPAMLFSGITPATFGATHKYFGYASVVAGAVTALTSSSEDFHHAAAYTASGLALLAITTGIIGNGPFIDLSRGLSSYNSHALLGILGGIGFAAAIALAGDEGDHAAFGIGGDVAMGVAIAILRWPAPKSAGSKTASPGHADSSWPTEIAFR